jgi:hypothetical protein
MTWFGKNDRIQWFTPDEKNMLIEVVRKWKEQQ